MGKIANAVLNIWWNLGGIGSNGDTDSTRGADST